MTYYISRLYYLLNFLNVIIVVILNSIINGINITIVDNNTIAFIVIVVIVVAIEYMIKLPIVNLF